MSPPRSFPWGFFLVHRKKNYKLLYLKITFSTKRTFLQNTADWQIDISFKMTRSRLESGSSSFLKKDRKASNSYCILEILITNNSRCSRPRSRSSNHIYRLKLRLYSQSLPRLPNAMRQNRLRTSIPLTCRPHPSCFPSLIISRRPVSRITVIIRAVRCLARPILDSRSQ